MCVLGPNGKSTSSAKFSEFGSPMAGAIDIDSKGNLYAIDAFEPIVRTMDSSGNQTGEWQLKAKGGEKPSLSAIAADSKSNIYLVQSWEGSRVNNKENISRPTKLWKCTSSGRVLGEWTLLNPDGFHDVSVQDLAIDSKGFIYVLGSSSVLKFDPSGRCIAEIGEGSSISMAKSVAVDARDSVYVAESDGKRILKYSPDGKRFTTIAVKLP